MSLRFNTSTFTFAVFIISAKENGCRLCFLCCSLGYLTSLPKCTIVYQSFASLSIFRGKIVSFAGHQPKHMCSKFLNYCPLMKVAFVQICKRHACVIRIVLIFHIIIGSLCILFQSLTNPISKRFF